MPRRPRLLSPLSIVLLAAAGALASGGPAHDLTWRTVDGGGGVSTGASFALTGTIGQPDADVTMSAASFAVTGGFWAAPLAPPCPGDLDHDGTVGFADIVALLSAWGACPGCPEDLNDDGVVDFADLVIVLASYGACPG